MFSLAGRYSCIIDRDTIPYIQWQTIILEERPNILLSTNELKFQCEDKLVLLTCCEKKYDVEWIPIPSGDEVTPQGHTYRLYIITNLLSAVIS